MGEAPIQLLAWVWALQAQGTAKPSFEDPNQGALHPNGFPDQSVH